MRPPVKYRLTDDAASVFRARGNYAVKGEVLELVAAHGRTWVMGNAKGERFPVSAKKLKPI